MNPDLNEDIYNLIEASELDPEQESKLERELSRQLKLSIEDGWSPFLTAIAIRNSTEANSSLSKSIAFGFANELADDR